MTMSPGGIIQSFLSFADQVRPEEASESGERGDCAPDLAEVLEHDAEQHGIAGSDIATAYPRLGNRADKGHALVLVDGRQGSVKKGAGSLRRRHIVDEGGGVGQADGLVGPEGPIARQLRGDVKR